MPEKHLDIDAYMKAQSGAGKAIAERIRAIIAHTVPDMTEAIQYQILCRFSTIYLTLLRFLSVSLSMKLLQQSPGNHQR